MADHCLNHPSSHPFSLSLRSVAARFCCLQLAHHFIVAARSARHPSRAGGPAWRP